LYINISYLDIDTLTADLASEMQTVLEGYVSGALRRGDVYNENDEFLPEVLERAYVDAVSARLEESLFLV